MLLFGTEPGAGSDRIKDSTFVHEGMVRKVPGEYLDPCSKWLDPVATAPGSVPGPWFSAGLPGENESTDPMLLFGTEPGAVATGSKTQLSSTKAWSEKFKASTSTHAVSGWTSSLPLRVLYLANRKEH